MKILIVGYGTRGDFQPTLALLMVLKARGHSIRLLASPNFERVVASCEVEFVPIGIDFQEVLDLDTTKNFLRRGKVREFYRSGMSRLAELYGDLGLKLKAAVQDVDAIICQGVINDWGWAVAEKFHLPLILTYTFPMIASYEYPNPFVSSPPLPSRAARRLTHIIYKWFSWRYTKTMINELRLSLGLAPARAPAIGTLRARGIPMLHMWGDSVVARPRAWGKQDILTGYWQLPQRLRDLFGEGAPPAGLREWIDNAPEPPIFIGFGSMPIENPDSSLTMAVAAARQIGHRIICSFGDGHLPKQSVDTSTFVIGRVDHDWLFQQCLTVIHHGGAGTTAASLTAGVPTLICSVTSDQPFWGWRVATLGVGAHLPFSKMNEQTLTAALRTVLRDDVRARARELGAKLRAEDGLARAVEVIESELKSRGLIAGERGATRQQW